MLVVGSPLGDVPLFSPSPDPLKVREPVWVTGWEGEEWGGPEVWVYGSVTL